MKPEATITFSARFRVSDGSIEAQEIDDDRVNRELQRSGSIIYQHVLRRKDGTVTPVEISSRLIESGNHLAIQSFVRDIASRERPGFGG